MRVPKSVPSEALTKHLVAAATSDDINHVSTLLSLGADPNGSPTALHTPLYAAMLHQRDSVLPLLLVAGADVNLPAANGETPMDLAIRKQRIDWVDLLLRYSVDLSHRNLMGRNYLQQAIADNLFDIAALLMKAGADLTLQDHKGRSALEYVDWVGVSDPRFKDLFDEMLQDPLLMIRYNQNNLLMQRLRQDPILFYIFDDFGNNIYHYAKLFDNEELWNMLPPNNRLATQVNDAGQTPEQYALMRNSLLTADELLDITQQLVIQESVDPRMEQLLDSFAQVANTALAHPIDARKGPYDLPALPLPFFFSLLPLADFSRRNAL